MLKFSPANAKTKNLQSIPALVQYLQGKRKVYSLDLPAGYSCPGAKDCLSKCVDGKIRDGQFTKFRCFSASQEVTYPNVHRARMHNFQALRACESLDEMCTLILASLPKNAGIVRYHVSGDFFNLTYFKAAAVVALFRPDVLFYGYTKSLHLLKQIKYVDLSQGIIRPNFLITASRGGTCDSLIDELGVRTAKVVFAEDDTTLPIDHTDEHAATIGGSFALLIHGIQPKGTAAAKAWEVIRRQKGGYKR